MNLHCEVEEVVKCIVRMLCLTPAHLDDTAQRLDAEREVALDSHIVLLGSIALVADKQLDYIIYYRSYGPRPLVHLVEVGVGIVERSGPRVY